MKRFLPAEWHSQYAVQLTWPHKNTDWAWVLDDIQTLYIELINTILEHENVILSVADADDIPHIQAKIDSHPFQCFCYVVENNDTWARDHGPIGVYVDNQLVMKDFRFNGWGGKFNAELDNQISQKLFDLNAYPSKDINPIDFILEGGSIESDGKGCLLTTSQCLMNDNRNPQFDQTQIEQLLSDTLGCEKVLWLDHGDLEGDDTDAHVDTLARLAPNNQIIYQGCQDPDDSHFADLQNMKQQLSQFTNAAGEAFTLVELPWPSPQYETGTQDRLPATYANFLFINGAVLLPTYGVVEDKLAIDVMQKALPEFKIIPINCSVVIRQFGSLHCLTMQIPTEYTSEG